METLESINIRHYQGIQRDNVQFGWPSWMKLQLQYEDNLLGNIRGAKVLDVGCGIGRDTYRFGKRGAKVTAVDISQKNLDTIPFECRKICSNAEDLTEVKDEYYDIVFCRALLHHLSNPSMALEQMKRKLVKGGILLFDEPLEKNFLLEIGRNWRNKYDNRLVDQNPFTIKECKDFMKTLSLKNIKINYFYSFFNVIFQGISVISKRYLGVNIDFIVYGLYLDCFHYLDDFILRFNPEQGTTIVCAGVK